MLSDKRKGMMMAYYSSLSKKGYLTVLVVKDNMGLNLACSLRGWNMGFRIFFIIRRRFSTNSEELMKTTAASNLDSTYYRTNHSDLVEFLLNSVKSGPWKVIHRLYQTISLSYRSYIFYPLLCPARHPSYFPHGVNKIKTKNTINPTQTYSHKIPLKSRFSNQMWESPTIA